MIVDLIAKLGFWSWWILGLVLLGVEVLLPGFLFLWFGIAALLIGLSAALVDWPWQMQMVGFVVLAVVSALIGRRFAGTHDTPSDDPHINRRTGRLEGRTFVLAAKPEFEQLGQNDLNVSPPCIPRIQLAVA